jgi:hypothetical protein
MKAEQNATVDALAESDRIARIAGIELRAYAELKKLYTALDYAGKARSPEALEVAKGSMRTAFSNLLAHVNTIENEF